MNKNIIIIGLILAGVFTFTVKYIYHAGSVDKNIILIVSDSLRYDIIGANGGKAKTPNIDWLIRNGISFTMAYSPSPRTLPSSVGIFTGKNPASYPYIPKKNDLGDRFIVPDTEYLFAESLRDSGYKVRAYVDNPNVYISNNLQGFDLIKNDTLITLEQEKNVNKVTAGLRGYLPYHQVYSFVDSLLLSVGSGSFFSLLWINDPHVPYEPPDDFKRQVDADPEKLPKPYGQYAMVGNEFLEFSDYEKDYVRALYLKEVESMDERIGLIIKALNVTGFLENTIVVFTADHGEQFGEHGEVGHGGAYFEELMHVPLVICGAGIPKNKSVDYQVSLLDLVDILGSLVKFSGKDGEDGIIKILYDKLHVTKPLYLFGTRIEYQKYIDAILVDGYKLIAKNDGNYSLYNVVEDHKEIVDLSSKEQQKVAIMKKILDQNRGENETEMHRKDMDTEITTLKSDKDEKETIKKLKSLGYIK